MSKSYAVQMNGCVIKPFKRCGVYVFYLLHVVEIATNIIVNSYNI